MRAPKSKTHPIVGVHQIVNLKTTLLLAVLSLFLAFSLIFLIKLDLVGSLAQNQNPLPLTKKWSPPTHANGNGSDSCCNKIPRSLSHALLHYSTSTITPQQTLNEISVAAGVLDGRSPCNFLVFGLGHDSLLWAALNHGGRTVFLEEDESWVQQIRRRFPMLESYHVRYETRVGEAEGLMEVGKGPECTAVVDPKYSVCQLALKGLPEEVYEVTWDLIMVDAPTGFYEEAPGRMAAIYTAGMMGRKREDGGFTDVFVHDVNREVEDRFSMEFLCKAYFKKQVGRLRHFTIPSHRDDLEKPFCPF